MEVRTTGMEKLAGQGLNRTKSNAGQDSRSGVTPHHWEAAPVLSPVNDQPQRKESFLNSR